MSGDFDVSGALRRIRRIGDLSQRQLASSVGISAAAIAHAEAGTRNLSATVLARAAALVGLRLALVDADGSELTGMVDEAVRDLGGRRFPAHLDTRHVEEGWWHDDSHWTRPQSWYTFDLSREARDLGRRSRGTPDDHRIPQPDDS